MVSGKMGITRGSKWHYSVGEKVPETTIILDVENIRYYEKRGNIVEIFRYMDKQYQTLQKALEGESVLNLTYEKDILQDPMQAYKKVCNWLEVEEMPAKINLVRTNTRKLSDVIKNWDDVVSALKNTDYGWMTNG
jgi:hypothetical protein